MNIKRGDIFLTNLEPVKGSEQGKIRPCLIVQNNVANEVSPNTIIVPITSTIPDKYYPSVVVVSPSDSGLKKTSSFLCSQVRTVSVKHRLMKKIGSLNSLTMRKVDEALKASLALD